MLKIGLTGPSGAGKGAFCRYLEAAYGIPSIDADRVYHGLLIPPSECLSEIVAAFGSEVLCTDGTLNRAALSAIVFSPSDASVRAERIARLNAITHPHVLSKMQEIAEQHRENGAPAVIFDAPALYESGLDKACDLNIAVTASPETRILRIIARDGISRERAEARVYAQREDAFYTGNADEVLHNDGTEKDLQHAAAAFCRRRLSTVLEPKKGEPPT